MSKTMKLQTGYRVSFDAYVPPPPTPVGTTPPPAPSGSYTIKFLGSPNTIRYVLNDNVYPIYNYGDAVVFPVNYVINYVCTAPGKEVVFGSHTVTGDYDIVVDLADANPANTGPGALMIVRSTPIDANILLNGSTYGFTNRLIAPAVGSYTFALTKSGYADYTTNYTLAAGDIVIVNQTLSAAYPAAGIYVDYRCSGFDKYNRYTNGTGGYYETLVETNSSTCGFVASTYTFQTSHDYSNNPIDAPKATAALYKSGSLVYQGETPFTLQVTAGDYTYVADESAGTNPDGTAKPLASYPFTVTNIPSNKFIRYDYSPVYLTTKTYYAWLDSFDKPNASTQAYLDIYTDANDNTGTLGNVFLRYRESVVSSTPQYNIATYAVFNAAIQNIQSGQVNNQPPDTYVANNVVTGSLSGKLGKDNIVSISNVRTYFVITTQGNSAEVRVNPYPPGNSPAITLYTALNSSFSSNRTSSVGVIFDVNFKDKLPGTFVAS